MLDGKILGGDSVKKTLIASEEVNVLCSHNVVNKFKYDNLFVFSDVNISGLPDIIKQRDEYVVVDTLQSISLVASTQKTALRCHDALVRELYIIKEHNTAPIRLYALSCLSKKQLTEFDFSDTMVKFKSEHLLRENGFQGTSIAKNKRSDIAVETIQRIVNKKMDFYKNTDRIKFFYGRS